MNINKENLPNHIDEFKNQNKIDNYKLAYILDSKVSYIEDILNSSEKVSDEFLKQFAILYQIGVKDYQKLSKSDKEKISEKIGAITMSGISIGSIATVISGLGITGLSGAGIMSGLAAIGAFVGGGSMIGITIVATAPIIAGTIGYFGIKKVNQIIKKQKAKK
ncbi:hypothetical protein [Empedobacter brevis]